MTHLSVITGHIKLADAHDGGSSKHNELPGDLVKSKHSAYDDLSLQSNSPSRSPTAATPIHLQSHVTDLQLASIDVMRIPNRRSLFVRLSPMHVSLGSAETPSALGMTGLSPLSLPPSAISPASSPLRSPVLLSSPRGIPSNHFPFDMLAVDAAIKLAATIFCDFIDNRSPIAVNLSSAVARPIITSFAQVHLIAEAGAPATCHHLSRSSFFDFCHAADPAQIANFLFHVFDQAQSEVFQLMSTDCLGRFLRSAIFRKLVTNLHSPSSPHPSNRPPPLELLSP